MGAHALLSASSSKRWLNCPPSARLEENFPNESSAYAEEGTWAHELCEYKVKRYLHRRMKRPQSEYLTEEIENLTDIYAEFVIGVIEKLKAQGHSCAGGGTAGLQPYRPFRLRNRGYGDPCSRHPAHL